MLMIYYLLFSVSSFLFSYEIGETITMSHQNAEYELCYGSELDPNNDGLFSFSEYNGDLNGGSYYVIFLEMGTSWWPACFSSISSFDNVYTQWENNENVLVFQSLGDLNQPYSCNQWGNFGISNIPMITDDTGLPIFGLFHTENLLPSSVFIDHTMTVHYKEAGFSGES